MLVLGTSQAQNTLPGDHQGRGQAELAAEPPCATGRRQRGAHTRNKTSLTRVIFRKSKDGRGQRALSSRLRLRGHFLPTSTHGCERHRSRPSRRPSSGVDQGLLLAEGRGVPTSARCSCDRDKRRLQDRVRGPAGRQGGPEPPSLPSPQLPLAEGTQGAGGEVGPATGRAQPSSVALLGRLAPRLSCSVALPPLWHRLLDTGVQTLEPPGHQGERQRASPSGSDRERQCRLVGGAEGGPALSLRSVALMAPRPVSGPHVPVAV